VHEEEEDDRRKPSASRQWQVAASGKMGKRAAKQTTLQFAIRVEAAGGDPVAAVAEHVPSAVDGSGLDVVVRASERALALDVAANERQGGSKKKKRGHQLNPALKNHAGAKSACWVFFREAKEGESKEFVYCIACEYLDNGAAPNAADRIRISHYGKDDAKLHAGNAMSHLKQHKAWWESVKDGASKGFNAQILFADLVKGKKRRAVQGQATLTGFVSKAQKQPGLVEKELRLVIWMVRNKIAFHALDDTSWKEMCESFGVKLSSSKTLKRYLFALSEIALRDAEKEIKESGSYSIAVDYWTSVARDKYMAITYHYADKTNLAIRSRVLDLVDVKGNATAKHTKELIDQCLVKHFEQKRTIFK
jgi:hypothetical protein